MDENTSNVMIARYGFGAAAAVILTIVAALAYSSHESTRATVEVQQLKVDEQKAERDRAMFDGMGRQPQK